MFECDDEKEMQDVYIRSELANKHQTYEIPNIISNSKKFFENYFFKYYKIIEKNQNDRERKLIKLYLSDNYISTMDLKFILCTTDSVFMTLSNPDDLPKTKNLNSSICKFISSLKNLDRSQNKLFDNNDYIVIKTISEENDFNDLLREYFIGVTAINKLRYKIPTFVYTVGMFLSKPNSMQYISSHSFSEYDKSHEESSTIPYIILEKIPGKTVHKILPNLSFKKFFFIFYQILISLEIAQNMYGFTHFDLHYNNIVIRNDKKIESYNIILSKNDITIKPYDLLPVIIDFGLSTIRYGENFIGAHGYSHAGIKRETLPGFDMYKFLVYCGSASVENIELFKGIKGLFSFFKEHDPYRISSSKSKNIFNTVVREYCSKITGTRMVQNTPIEMIEMIHSTPKYRKLLNEYVIIRPKEEISDVDICNNSVVMFKKFIKTSNNYILVK